MDINKLIEKKKKGEELSREEIELCINSYSLNKISDNKMISFMKIIDETNFSYRETYFFADAMAHTGKMINISSKLGEVVADKHSAGKLSDPTTLIYMSVLASLGIKTVKVLSGYFGNFRNSNDRFSAITNFNFKVKEKKLITSLEQFGMGVCEDRDISPVDKKLYHLRNRENIVSIPLIAASILSKKIATGSNLIVFDVKSGEGAIGEGENFAIKLAEYLTNAGKLANINCASVVTNLDEPITSNIGNKAELKEVVVALKNEGKLYDSRLLDVAKELVVIALMLSKKAKSRSEAGSMFDEAITSQKAYNTFKQFVEFYGGTLDDIENRPSLLDGVSTTYLLSNDSGYISNIKISALRDSLQLLNQKSSGSPDKYANIELLINEGTKVEVDQKIARLLFSIDNKNFFKAKETLQSAYEISKTKPPKKDLFYKLIV